MSERPSERGAGTPSADDGVPLVCPLCAGGATALILESDGRAYHQCTQCDLVFLDPLQRLRPLAEVMRYLEHNNDAADAGYMAFLQRLGDPVQSRLAPGARGLDFGCGPGRDGWLAGGRWQRICLVYLNVDNAERLVRLCCVAGSVPRANRWKIRARSS